jgi:hypothetical protein
VGSSQFHSQDEAGNIAYGYQNINSAKQESGNIYGGVQGSYSYVDEAGGHTVHYVADDFGFRVVSDNLPVAPVHHAVAPVPVEFTPEVIEARAAFLAAYDAELHRTRRSAQVAFAFPGATAPTAFAHPAAYAAYAHPAAVAPAVHAAPTAAAREAVLTTIKLNPGHATFYRVD